MTANMGIHPWRFPMFGFQGYGVHCQRREVPNQFYHNYGMHRNVLNTATVPLAMTSQQRVVSNAVSPYKYTGQQNAPYGDASSLGMFAHKNDHVGSEYMKERLIYRKRQYRRWTKPVGSCEIENVVCQPISDKPGPLSTLQEGSEKNQPQPGINARPQIEGTGECSPVFYNDKQLTTHKRVYHCTDCQYTTDRKNNLKRHISTMHEHCSKLLECCDMVFNNKASLRQHVSACHRHGYDCAICGRTFCRKALLKRHVTVHSGQKDYVCVMCGYATSHKSNLDRHKRRHIPKQLRANLLPRTEDGLVSTQTKSNPLLRSSFSGRFDKVASYDSPWFVYQQRRMRAASMQAAKDKKILKKRLLQAYQKIMRPNQEEQQRTAVSPETSKPVRDCSSSCIPKKRLNIRLVPSLHRCQRCHLVFANQVLLTNHISSEHTKMNYDEPQRPLTLVWRPRLYPQISPLGPLSSIL